MGRALSLEGAGRTSAALSAKRMIRRREGGDGEGCLAPCFSAAGASIENDALGVPEQPTASERIPTHIRHPHTMGTAAWTVTLVCIDEIAAQYDIDESAQTFGDDHCDINEMRDSHR